MCCPMMKYLILPQVLAALSITLLLSVGTVGAVPPLIPSSEHLIASMEINKSAGNMTGDDYLVALVFAYINDMSKHSMNEGTAMRDKKCPEYDKLSAEASTKFPEYADLLGTVKYYSLEYMMTDSWKANGQPLSNFTMPQQGYIDNVINNIFYENLDNCSRKGSCESCCTGQYVNEARAKANSRLKEEARQKAFQRDKETKKQAAEQEKIIKQRAAEQERMEYQLAVDAHYKNLSASYTSNLTVLLNQSKIADALNLSDEAIKQLVSPYSNIMIISKGDIYTTMGRFEEAIENYQNAQKEFTYSNDSAEYQNKVQQDFERDWNTIVLYKINLARQKLNDEIFAKKHDLTNAPNVKQLLRGHDGSREYSIDMENHTFVGGGYIVSINLSAVNKPIDPTNETDIYIKTSDDTKAFVPLCVDIFGGLFADKRVAYVCIQNNETYLDRFGHENEVPVRRACMNNKTATQVGNWNDFKQYVAIDVDKLSSVASVQALKESEE